MICTAAIALGASAAYAQAAPAEDQPATANQPAANQPAGQEIIVTGSRIARPNLESVSPVTVLGSQDVKLQGITRTEDLINTLPQAFAGQGGNIANGASGTATVNLRGLGSIRTLVLVNGRRLLPGDPTSVSSSAADINAIPSALIERVDVLTGGASSVYGSDAVAGVVNFIMDSDFEGFRLDGQYSLFNHDNNGRKVIRDAIRARGFNLPDGNVTDGGTVDVSATIGAGFDDGRGHVTAYATYRKIKEVLQGDRDYSACAATAASPANVAAGRPIVTCGGSAASANGTFFTNTDVLQVGPNRTLIPGNTPFNFAPFNHFQRPDERYTLGAFATYEISDAIKPYLETMFMDDRTRAQIAPSGNFGNTLTINCDNPLLSAQQLAIVCDPGNLVTDATGAPQVFIDPTTGATYNRGNLQIYRRNIEGGGRVDDLQHTDFRIVGGVRGDISDAWSYDAYYQFARVNYAETYFNDFSASRITRALDVVTGPAGAPVCRSTLDGTDANCVPYDIFALNSVSPAALGYLQTPGFQRGNTQERVASASITGQLGEYGIQTPWADEGVGINVGAEYRKESLELNADTAFQTGDLTGQGGATLPVAGAFHVRELFGEMRVPIVQDSFIKDLSLEAGYRYSRYTVGDNKFSTDTYKFGLEFAPISDIRLRASYNRAVRAPNVQELFAPQRVVLNGSSDPCAGSAPTATLAQCLLTGITAAQYGNIQENPAGQYNGLIGGDPTLDPEVSTTKSLGLVLTPTFLPGFSATVDYFNIKVKKTIQQVGQDTTIATCIATGDPTFCSLIHRDQFGSLWRTPGGFIRDLSTNIGSLKTSGIDVGANYNYEFDTMGSLGFSLVGTWLDKLITDNGVSQPYNCAGFFGLQCGTPNPEWRHKLRLTWTTPWDIGVSLQWRYFSKVEQDVRSSNPTLNGTGAPFNAKIPAQSYFDLAFTADVGDHLSLRLGAENLLDKDPPIIGSNGTFNAGTPVFSSGNTFPQVYDAMGRYIYVGATVTF